MNAERMQILEMLAAGKLTVAEAEMLLNALAATAEAASGRASEPTAAEPGQIEIALGRMRVRVTGPVDPALLETILTCIHRR